jgi:hypothetical protein
MARPTPNDPVARLRVICLALPEAQEKLRSLGYAGP